MVWSFSHEQKQIAMQQDDNKMPKTDNKREKQAPQPKEQQNKRVEEKPELTTLNNPKISGGTSDKGSRDNTNDTIGNP
jgi:hypothetical protein